MANLELLELYPSPWSERVRWVLEWKGVPYARRSYRPLVDEEELRRSTGHATVPVLTAGGEQIGDSEAALEWIEEKHPTPALLPSDPKVRAVVRAWELAVSGQIAPFGRLIAIGRWKAMDMQPFADHFASKYAWSPAIEAGAARVLTAFVDDLARTVEGTPYLVGNAFTRADLTVACMLGPILGMPSDDLFELDDGMRAMFGIPLGDEPRLAPLRRWRDDLYRRHRGGRVTPPAG
jgi:glutathione S-transferase